MSKQAVPTDRQGFIPVVLIAVLALVITVGGVGVGLAWKTDVLDKVLPPNIKELFGRGERPEEKPEEEPTEEPEEDLTKDWKTYTNTKHKYQFKVPKDFEIQVYTLGPVEQQQLVVDSADAVSVTFEGEPEDEWAFFIGKFVHIVYMPDPSFYNPPSGTELISWLKKWEHQPPEKPNLEIDGIPAVKIYDPGTPGIAYPMDEIHFIKGDKLFKIQMPVFDEQDREFYSLILSTFKFIE